MSHYRKLGKPTDQRVAMLRAMTTYLLENGQIKTTVSRAKEVAPIAEKMITLAKNANLANYRRALSWLTKEDVAKKLFDEIGPKYASRNGGYTRVVKIGPRRGDAAEMAIVSWSDPAADTGKTQIPPLLGRDSLNPYPKRKFPLYFLKKPAIIS